MSRTLTAWIWQLNRRNRRWHGRKVDATHAQAEEAIAIGVGVDVGADRAATVEVTVGMVATAADAAGDNSVPSCQYLVKLRAVEMRPFFFGETLQTAIKFQPS